jgi:hypothetical protein
VVADGWEHIRHLDLAFQTRHALMDDDDVGTSHFFLILVELCCGLLVFLLPEVCFNFRDQKEWPIGVVWVWLRSVDWQDGDGDRHHCSDCLQDLITVDQLEMVRDVFEGVMETGCIVRAGIIKNVVRNALRLPFELSR